MMVPESPDYWNKRALANEAALRSLMELLCINFPMMVPNLNIIGQVWNERLDNLDAEYGQQATH